MPRQARGSLGGVCYHVINYGNALSRVFHDEADYAHFVGLLSDACQRIPMRVLGFCLMPNHIHLVLWPRHDGDLSRFMQWLLTSHVRRFHGRYGSRGRVWQGRYKAFPVQRGPHLAALLRHVERNPIRARYVARAEQWPWSSVRLRMEQDFLDAEAWVRWVNRSRPDPKAEVLEHCIRRSRPYGELRWAKRMASRLGLESSLRPVGRPRKRQAR